MIAFISKICNYILNNKRDVNFKRYIRHVTENKYKNLELYHTAFTHRSLESNIGSNNERLEFLGDSILQAIFTHYLYIVFPDKSEGELTKVKSMFLSRKNLGKISKKLHILKYLKCSESIQIKNLKYVEGNVFEALVGAIFLDLGFDKCYKIVIKNFFNEPLTLNIICYKSKILEWGQKHKKEVTFVLLQESQKIQKKKFGTSLKICNEILSVGYGENKIESQQKASKIALKKLNLI